jgi:hypothetical protein
VPALTFDCCLLCCVFVCVCVMLLKMQIISRVYIQDVTIWVISSGVCVSIGVFSIISSFV